MQQKSLHCSRCNKRTLHDRWTGRTRTCNTPAGLSRKLVLRVLAHYGYRDAIEGRERAEAQLVVDHRVPMVRWGKPEDPVPDDAPVDLLERKFQVLKKDAAGNHNKLKTEACKRCLGTGKRGTPLGIKFFYAGGENWPINVPKTGPDAERGCYGCGWFDVLVWRARLNAAIAGDEG